MKKRSAIAVIALTAALIVMMLLGGCGQDSVRSAPTQQQGVSEVMQGQPQGNGSSGAVAGSFVGDASCPYDSVDYDLTSMSSDMVYATVYDMVTNPTSYVGKVVRMSGPYYHTFYEATDQDYFYVIIQDATACCAQGLEFVWGDGTHAYPQDYPADETEVVVTGIFETYDEDGTRYVHLVDASMQAHYSSMDSRSSGIHSVPEKRG